MYLWSQQNNAKQCLFQCTEIGRIKTRNIKVWSFKYSHGTYGNNLLLILHEIHWSRELSVPWLIAEHKIRDQMSAHLLIWNARTWAELQEDLSWGQEQLTKASALREGSDSEDLQFLVPDNGLWRNNLMLLCCSWGLLNSHQYQLHITSEQLCREPAEVSVLAWPTWPKAGQGNFFMLQTHYTQ